MAQIGVQIEIPKNFFCYDVASEELSCGGCNKNESFPVVNAKAPEKKEGAERARGISPKSRFKDFMDHHAGCVIKHMQAVAATTHREPKGSDFK